jgi:hypothetical protein
LGISGALLICFLLLRSKTDLRSKPKNSAVFADAPSEAQENIQEGNEVLCICAGQSERNRNIIDRKRMSWGNIQPLG